MDRIERIDWDYLYSMASESQLDDGVIPNRLNVGCGPDWRRGYVNLDCERHQDPEGGGLFISGDFRYLYQRVGRGPTGCGWQAILGHYCLEHISPDDVYHTLWEWNQCLRIGGTVEIVVPDFGLLVDLFQRDAGLSTFRILCYEVTNIEGSLHASVWTEEWLRHFLVSEGFEVEFWERGVGCANLGIRMIARKAVEKGGLGLWESYRHGS